MQIKNTLKVLKNDEIFFPYKSEGEENCFLLPLQNHLVLHLRFSDKNYSVSIYFMIIIYF